MVTQGRGGVSPTAQSVASQGGADAPAGCAPAGALPATPQAGPQSKQRLKVSTAPVTDDHSGVVNLVSDEEEDGELDCGAGLRHSNAAAGVGAHVHILVHDDDGDADADEDDDDEVQIITPVNFARGSVAASALTSSAPWGRCPGSGSSTIKEERAPAASKRHAGPSGTDWEGLERKELKGHGLQLLGLGTPVNTSAKGEHRAVALAKRTPSAPSKLKSEKGLALVKKEGGAKKEGSQLQSEVAYTGEVLDPGPWADRHQVASGGSGSGSCRPALPPQAALVGLGSGIRVDAAALRAAIGEGMWDALYPFQQQGVVSILTTFGGKALLAVRCNVGLYGASWIGA
jgi:hypothetical protein